MIVEICSINHLDQHPAIFYHGERIHACRIPCPLLFEVMVVRRQRCGKAASSLSVVGFHLFIRTRDAVQAVVPRAEISASGIHTARVLGKGGGGDSESAGEE